MVSKNDTGLKYKNYNKGTRSHNSSSKGYNKFKSDRTVESRGLFRYLFSLQGVMSRDVFTGFMPLLFIFTLLIQNVALIFTNKIVGYSIGILYLLSIWLTIATAYKRSHALGISGWYSIFGMYLSMPFFYFNRQDNEYINENVKGCSFKLFKNIGAFLNKNWFIKFLYIICFYAIISVMNRNKDAIFFILGVASFNIFQLIFGFKKIFVRYYKNIVKVSSFVAYNIAVTSVGMMIIYSIAYEQIKQQQINLLDKVKQEKIHSSKNLIKK